MLGAPREEAASKMLGCREAGVVTGEMASRSAPSAAAADTEEGGDNCCSGAVLRDDVRKFVSKVGGLAMATFHFINEMQGQLIMWGDATLGDWMATGLLAESRPCSTAGSTTTEGVGGAAASSLEAEVVVERGGGCVVIRMTMASMEGRRRNSSPGGGGGKFIGCPQHSGGIF